MKINVKLLEKTITRVINENLHYPTIDSVSDNYPSDYINSHDVDYIEDRENNDKPNWSTASNVVSNSPFKNKNTINEIQLRNIVKETIVKILNENYPLGAEFDPRAPWNEPETTSKMVEIQGTAYYYNEETEEEKEVPFEIEVEVDGEYLVDYNDDEKQVYFQPNEDMDYYSLAVNSGKIPHELDGGFRLEDIEVDEF